MMKATTMANPRSVVRRRPAGGRCPCRLPGATARGSAERSSPATDWARSAGSEMAMIVPGFPLKIAPAPAPTTAHPIKKAARLGGEPSREDNQAETASSVTIPVASTAWVFRPAEHVTPEMLLERCDTPLLAVIRCAIVLAEARGWSAATITGVFYGLKAVLAGHTGEDLALLSEVRERVRPRSHSSATRIVEVLAEVELLHEETTAAIRAWIDRRTGELAAGSLGLLEGTLTGMCGRSDAQNNASVSRMQASARPTKETRTAARRAVIHRRSRCCVTVGCSRPAVGRLPQGGGIRRRRCAPCGPAVG